MSNDFCHGDRISDLGIILVEEEKKGDLASTNH